MAQTSRWRALIAALLSALLSIIFTASVSWTAPPAAIPEPDHAFLQAHPVVVLADRFVCSLLSSQQSKAGVVGADGSHSVAVDGVVYWNFGDTVLADGRIIPNSLGWSSDRDASDCITLVPKGTTASSAPLLPRDPGSEQSVWPLGMEETSAGIVHFYYAASVKQDGGSDVEGAGVGLASFDAETLEAKRALDSVYGLFQRLEEPSGVEGQGDAQLERAVTRLTEAFRRMMDDDFNTAAAIAQCQLLRGEVNRLLETGLSARARAQAREAFRSLGRVLDLFQLSVKEWEFKELEFRARPDDRTQGSRLDRERPEPPPFTDEQIERQLAERNEARRRKDFARADAIRTELSAHGITIEDRPDGTSRWKR